MKNIGLFILLCCILAAGDMHIVFSQINQRIDGTQADMIYRREGIHRGNQVRTIFTNYGVIGQPHGRGPMAAWRADGDGYVGDISPMVGAEIYFPRYDSSGNPVIGPDGFQVQDTIRHVVVTPAFRPGSAVPGPPGGGKPWTFEPIAGFLNPSIDAPGYGVAMSHQPETWPDFWPDHPEYIDSLGNAVWNGYFGPGEINADQESYFWMSDHNDREVQSRRPEFRPDANRPNRGGLGFNMSVRGLQWSNILAEDNIFWLYDIHNAGTTTYRKTAFGILVGVWVGGGGNVSGEWDDNVSFFDIQEDITYAWKYRFREPTTNPRWVGPVGIVGIAFLESPGNPFDGIDNDNDSQHVGSPRFTTTDFTSTRNFRRTLNRNSPGPNANFPDNKIVLIDTVWVWSPMYRQDQLWYEREVVRLDTLLKSDTDTVTVYSLGKPYTIWHGKTLFESPNTGFDENLNGLIDENYDLHYEQVRFDPQGRPLFRRVRPVSYANYFTGAGTDDPMIDERRDDGIDNDGDWDPRIDDRDGTGAPSPGEPNFDATDPKESDQIGLTSFDYFSPANVIDMTNKSNIWTRMRPGFFAVPRDMFRYDPVTGENIPTRGEDGNYIYSSGYFPMGAGGTERMSVALVYGQNFDQLFHNKNTVQDIYNASYQFPQPPDKPTLTAVPGDGNVTLIWDDKAERSFNRVMAQFYPDDPDAAFDFEGYKIYRARDPDFSEVRTITDGRGNPRFYKPIAQFDLKNNITGYFNASPRVNERVAGAQFWLGDDTGIVHRFVDNNVQNGVTYYYALVAYNHGSAEFDVYPSENTRFISRSITGELVTDINTVVVVPNAPTAGYVPPEGAGILNHTAGPATGRIYSVIINPREVKDGRTYRVVFSDSTLSRLTQTYSVIDVTNSESPDTVVKRERRFIGETRFFHGLQLSFDNPSNVSFQRAASGWEENAIVPDFIYSLSPIELDMGDGTIIRGVNYPANYRIEFFDDPVGISHEYPELGAEAVPINLKIQNVTDETEPKILYYDFLYDDFRQITIALLEEVGGMDRLTWVIDFRLENMPELSLPGNGHVLNLRTSKPFSTRDVFEFTTTAEYHDADTARANLDNIRVVPNPYIAAAGWEQPLPPGIVSGRGERKIDFINIPQGATISIYTARGIHVVDLYHDGSLADGTVSWNLRTKENLDIAYGVYFYVVNAPNLGQKFGRIAIIK
jgi:hypothetical protein